MELYNPVYKYVIQAGYVDMDGLPTKTLGSLRPARPRFFGGQPLVDRESEIYLQPLDQQNENLNRLNMEAAVASCMNHGYRMCLQTHKIMGLE